MERADRIGQIMIECPNTIFYLYVADENEMSKIEIFMSNIATIKKLGLTDIYHWCNRQKIAYDTEFNYHKDFSLWKNVRSYLQYFRQKHKYQVGFGTV